MEHHPDDSGRACAGHSDSAKPLRSWSSCIALLGPACRSRPARGNTGSFLDRLIEPVTANENVDRAHIYYMAGMSNGRAMTYRYARKGRTKLANTGPAATRFTFLYPI